MLKLFAVYDEKAEAYGSIACIATRGLALRGFTDACADPKSAMAQCPSDYKLMELGSYDPNSGRIECLPQPLLVAHASAIVADLKLTKEVE